MIQAHHLYRRVFNRAYLHKLFHEKINQTSAVGRDGIRRDRFQSQLNREISVILRKVNSQNYKFTSYKEKLISKGPEKFPRQLSITTFRDRLTQRALCDILNIILGESKTLPPHEYIKNIRELMDDIPSDHCFLRIDIKNYYPSIDHKILIRKIRSRIRKKQILFLIENAIKTPTGKKNTKNNINNNGIPQGLSISNILSSFYLYNIDNKYIKSILYFRYVDDMLIICDKKCAEKIFEKIKQDLESMNLECHSLDGKDPGKTVISSLNEGIDYLGYHIRDGGRRDKISVRTSSYKRMFKNIQKVLTRYKYSRKKNIDQLIFKLNLKITGCIFDNKRLGWMFFFSQTENMSQLKRLDSFLVKSCKDYGIEKEGHRIKRFIKSFHEIRYNIDKTKYIPNFDKYSRDEKMDALVELRNRNKVELDTLSAQDLDDLFKREIAKEISELEKDLWEAIS